MTKLFSRISTVVHGPLLGGLRGAGFQAPGSMEVRQGVIEQITPMDLQSSQHTGVGAVVGGGLAGVALGSLIGGGTGRDVAMVAGAIGGAIAGNEVQKRYDRPQPGQQIIVRVKSGVLVFAEPARQSFLARGAGCIHRGLRRDRARVASLSLYMKGSVKETEKPLPFGRFVASMS